MTMKLLIMDFLWVLPVVGAWTAMDVKRLRILIEKFKLRVPQKETNLDILVRWKQLPKQKKKKKLSKYK